LALITPRVAEVLDKALSPFDGRKGSGYWSPDW